ncbi:MAG: hypothetical protein MRZ79_25860 [Bacteroidia bacterium]|nr:hypothetical protein [Bacteroidia bacterium]
MIIKKINAYQIRIPLKISFKQANSMAPSSNSIILEIYTQNGLVGYGECCPRSYVTGESPESVLEEIRTAIPKLEGLSILNLEGLKNLILLDLGSMLRPAALCAFDLALLDAFAKEEKTHVLHLLGGSSPEKIVYSGVVPMGSESRIRPILEAFSFESIKIKIGNDFRESEKRIAFIRSIYGNDISIRMDANTSWSYMDAIEQIPKFLKLGVNIFEQPFLPERNKDMGFLSRYFGKDAYIMADESLTDINSAFELISRNYCNRFNLKISKHGGLLRSLKICELAKLSGISCQMGAHFGETSILTKAGMVLASLAPELTHREGAFGTHVLKEDIFESSIKFDLTGAIRNPARFFEETLSSSLAKAS